KFLWRSSATNLWSEQARPRIALPSGKDPSVLLRNEHDLRPAVPHAFGDIPIPMRNRVMPKVARGGIARQQGDKDPSTLCVPVCLKEQVTKIRARQPQGRGYAIGRNVLDGCREPENVGVRRIVQIGYRQSTRAPVGLQTKRYEWNLPFINRTDAIRE